MHVRASVAVCAAASLLFITPAAAFAAPVAASVSSATTVGLDPAPSGLRIANAGNRTVWTDWADVAGATRYTVKVTVASNPDNLPTPSLGSTVYTGSSAKTAGLTNGVTYNFQVAATVNGKLTEYSTTVTAAPVPGGIPANVRVSEQGYAGGIVDFDAVPQATSYKAFITVVDKGDVDTPKAGTASVNVAGSFATVAALSLGATYQVRIAALVDGQYTDQSAPVTIVAEARPNKAGTPSPGVVNSSSIQVRWAATTLADQATAIEGYDLTWGPAGSTDLKTEHLDASARNFTANDLVRGTTYQFQLVASNAAGTGLKSALTRIVAADKPSAVKSPTAVRSAEGTAVDLDWKEPEFAGGGTITKYTVSVSPATAGYKVVVNPTDTSAKVTGLDKDIDYKFTINAYTSGGATGSIVGSLANAPKIGTPVIDAAGTVTVSFPKLANPKLSYQLRATQVLPAGGRLFSTNTITPDSVTSTADTVTATFKNFGSAINGEPWTFQVRATDEVNMFSNWDSVIPAAPADAASLVAKKKVKNDWTISYTGNWAARGSKGIWSMTANGVPVPTGTIEFSDNKPGDQLVEFQGLGGSSSVLVDLPDDGPHED